MFIAENFSLTDFLCLEVDLNDSKYVRSSRRAMSTVDCIPPRHRQIVFMIEWTNDYGETATLDYSHRTQYSRRALPSIPDNNHIQNGLHSFRPF